jgi:hypothetical protein
MVIMFIVGAPIVPLLAVAVVFWNGDASGRANRQARAPLLFQPLAQARLRVRGKRLMTIREGAP